MDHSTVWWPLNLSSETVSAIKTLLKLISYMWLLACLRSNNGVTFIKPLAGRTMEVWWKTTEQWVMWTKNIPWVTQVISEYFYPFIGNILLHKTNTSPLLSTQCVAMYTRDGHKQCSEYKYNIPCKSGFESSVKELWIFPTEKKYIL